MHAQFRFGRLLLKHRLTLLIGNESRCFASISCLTMRPYGRNLLSVNPALDPDSPEGNEAIAFQLGFLEAHPGYTGRMRFTEPLQAWPNVAQFFKAKDFSRAWRAGSRIAITEPMIAVARRRGLDHEAIAELCGVTHRMVEWRHFDEQLAGGRLICPPRPDAGTEFRIPDVMWCEL